MKREYYQYPILAAAGVIIIDDKVLIIKRKVEPNAGKWSIPGGAINLAEKIEDGLKREILEETGLKANVIKLVDIIERVYNDNEGKIIYHYIILDYLCSYISGDMKASSDAEDLKLVSLNELDNINMTEGTKKIIKKAFDILK